MSSTSKIRGRALASLFSSFVVAGCLHSSASTPNPAPNDEATAAGEDALASTYPDADGPGWRVRSGVLETVHEGLRVRLPPGWSLVFDANLGFGLGLVHERDDVHLRKGHPMRGRGMREHRATPRLVCSAAGEAHRGRVSCRTGPVRRDIAPELAQLREPEARLDHHGPFRVGSVTPRSRTRAGQLGLAFAAEADGHRGPDRRAPVRCRRACWRSSPSASHRGSGGRS
ncbi:hypothetical protein ENSA7_55860 [Enhygromyxa salina]|uniref:Uncharacterized protein n=1 Tax=Enhygromyxa salina TaxID=215803 RepID=A0A2S9YAF1_9BACT|nr:hypothetical protein ENSA7_55860 [Enhygromyxa salina]